MLTRMYRSPWKMYAPAPFAELGSTAPTPETGLSETAMQ